MKKKELFQGPTAQQWYCWDSSSGSLAESLCCEALHEASGIWTNEE